MAAQISLTNKQQKVLLQIITSRTHQQDHIERAKIILLASEGKTIIVKIDWWIKNKILSFVTYFNNTMAKAFKALR